MPTIKTKDATEIYYKDWGAGQPVVFSHGWPLSADDWDTQMLFFLNQGFRVIAHDRRGHGRSSQTGDGHDMDHYADDRVPRTHRRKEVRNCVRDGGRSSGAGRQGQASNHRKLRRSKAGVVSVAEKAGLDPVRYGSERRARANR